MNFVTYWHQILYVNRQCAQILHVNRKRAQRTHNTRELQSNIKIKSVRRAFLKGSQIFVKYNVKCENNKIFHYTLALVYVHFSLNGFGGRVYIVATPFLPAILYTEKLTAKLEIVRQFPVLLVLLLKYLLFN